MATDRVGLRILNSFWRRPAGKAEAIGRNEMGSTKVLLDAGYNLGSLQLFWKDHDFQDVPSTQRKCALLRRHAVRDKGGLVSCPGCHWNETDLGPLEILFVHRSVSFDKASRREVGATRDYTAMRAELERLAPAPSAAAWPRREGRGARLAVEAAGCGGAGPRVPRSESRSEQLQFYRTCISSSLLSILSIRAAIARDALSADAAPNKARREERIEL